MSNLHDRITENFFSLWELRAQERDRPEWKESPPLSLISCSLQSDLWHSVLDQYAGRLLQTDGDMGVGPNERYGNKIYLIENFVRGPSFATLWYWNYNGSDAFSEIDIGFPYYDGNGEHQATQYLKMYNPNNPDAHISRSFFINAYFETGYEGHGYKGEDANEDDRLFFHWILDLVEEQIQDMREQKNEDLPLTDI